MLNLVEMKLMEGMNYTHKIKTTFVEKKSIYSESKKLKSR